MSAARAGDCGDRIVIAPQPGPQTTFAECGADVAIFGGAAGGGKSFALMIEPLRHYFNALFVAVYFRRTLKQVLNPGGLWDQAMRLYPALGGEPTISNTTWTFPTQMRVRFAHLEHESNILDWQGAQVPLFCLDELTHFTRYMVMYLLSRLRSDSGVAGYLRATTNPDKNSWVREFIDWWIGADGLPIPARAGVLRWLIVENDVFHWFDSREEAQAAFPPPDFEPLSVTFIPAMLADNPALLRNDPTYRAKLLALPKVERERLLGGNWNVEATAGSYFQKAWFKLVDAAPGAAQVIRYWDRASTETKPGQKKRKKADWTVGLKLARHANGLWTILDVVRLQGRPHAVETAIKNTAAQDGRGVWIGLEQDPGQAGQADVDNLVRQLAGYTIKVNRPSVDKATRAGPVSSQAEQGNVQLLKRPWNQILLEELHGFPVGAHDDQVDSLSGAFNVLTGEVGNDYTPAMASVNIGTMAGSLGGSSRW